MNNVRIQTLAAIFIVAFLLNLIWEKLQMPLYAVNISAWDCWLLCIHASMWDAIIITGAYYLIDTPSRTHRYALSSILLFCIAIFIEQRALTEGRWAYTHLMPTVFGIGISPLIQLPLLAIATYETVRRIMHL